MKTIWIAGSKGQLGTEIQRQAPKINNTRFLFTDIEELDLTQAKAVEAFVKKEMPSLIINCSAYTAVDKAETDRDNAFLVNCKIPEILAKAAKLSKGILIHISTDYVFDGHSNTPLKESEPTNPQSVYGESKECGEKAALASAHNLVIRTAWLYSAHGNNFVKTMLHLGAEKEELNVVADQHGSPTSAADLADAVLQIIQRENIPGGIYHYANEGVCTWYDFAKEIMTMANLKCQTNPIPTSEYPTPAQRPMYSVMDTSKIKVTFGITIPDWRASLKKVIEELKG